MITVEGFVLFCDGRECRVRGPQALSPENILDSVEGWSLSAEEVDLCPKCVALGNVPRKP
jgi:hypothetical protein